MVLFSFTHTEPTCLSRVLWLVKSCATKSSLSNLASWDADGLETGAGFSRDCSAAESMAVLFSNMSLSLARTLSAGVCAVGMHTHTKERQLTTHPLLASISGCAQTVTLHSSILYSRDSTGTHHALKARFWSRFGVGITTEETVRQLSQSKWCLSQQLPSWGVSRSTSISGSRFAG